jgi:putative endonuclease
MTISNKAYAPFKVVYSEAFNLREEAIRREKYLKTAAGRRFLKKVLK